MSPQAKQALNAKKIQRGANESVYRHQNELENVISMLGKFERSLRGEESMSVTISRSYAEAAHALGQNPKATPQGVALKSDPSR